MSAPLPFHRIPYVLDGDDPVELARRSAQIDLEEADTLAADDPMVGWLHGSAARWRQQADELEAARAPIRTKSGRVLTEGELDNLAAEAERGYDVEHLRQPQREVPDL